MFAEYQCFSDAHLNGEPVAACFVQSSLPPRRDFGNCITQAVESKNRFGSEAEYGYLLPRKACEIRCLRYGDKHAVVGNHLYVAILGVARQQCNIADAVVFALSGSAEYGDIRPLFCHAKINGFGQVVGFLVGIVMQATAVSLPHVLRKAV